MHTKPEPGGAAISNRTPLQTFSLSRLHHLLEQRGRFAELLPGDDWRRKLIARALYSTYQDCVAQGIEGEAKKMVDASRAPERN